MIREPTTFPTQRNLDPATTVNNEPRQQQHAVPQTVPL